MKNACHQGPEERVVMMILLLSNGYANLFWIINAKLGGLSGWESIGMVTSIWFAVFSIFAVSVYILSLWKLGLSIRLPQARLIFFLDRPLQIAQQDSKHHLTLDSPGDLWSHKWTILGWSFPFWITNSFHKLNGLASVLPKNEVPSSMDGISGPLKTRLSAQIQGSALLILEGAIVCKCHRKMWSTLVIYVAVRGKGNHYRRKAFGSSIVKDL